MRYIYDILLNFNTTAYDIFEWNKSDFITHVRKIPFFKIKEEDFYTILNNKVKFSDDFLKNIYKKTEVFNKNKINNIEYCFLLTTGKETMAVKYGNNILYSKLLYDEELETLEYSLSMKLSNIQYDIESSYNLDNFKTRNELYIKNYISKQLKIMISNNDLDKLNYLYLEIFNCPLTGNINKIIKDIEINWDNIYLKIYDFLKTISLR